MTKRILFLFFLTSFISFGQIGMQQWRIHYSVFNAVGIAKLDDKVFMASKNGITIFDAEDNSIGNLTVTNGLSDLNLSAIKSNGEIIMIGYLNGNIDLIKGNSITNIPWLKLAQISGSKRVNSFLFSGNDVYISTGTGILVYDIEKNEISDTYYPYNNPNVLDVVIFNDTIYAGTVQGIYQASINQPFLTDLNNWVKKTNLPFHMVNANISQLEVFSNYLLIAYDAVNFNEDSLYKMNINNEISLFINEGLSINKINTQEDELILCNYSDIRIFDENFTQKEIIFDYTLSSPPSPIDAIKYDNKYWIADLNNGFVNASNSFNGKSISSNSPFFDQCYRLDIQYGKLVVAGGGLSHNLNNNYFRNGIYIFETEEWKNINYKNQSELNFNEIWDFISVAINPNNTNQIAFGTYSIGGLKIIEDGNNISQTYTSYNSILETQMGNGDNMIISDLKYDNDGNLWIVNAGDEPLKVLTPDGLWYSFNVGAAGKNKYPYRLTIDRNNNKWIAFEGVGIVVFNENGTFDDASDDKMRTLNTVAGSGNLPSSSVKAITEDVDGEIWIGTETGLAVIFSTSQIFDGGFGEYDAKSIYIEDGVEIEALFGKSSITAIAVDGGDRKWIGTASSGVFCISPNGLEEIYHFNTSNSPLLSNGILDIRMDYFTGEVYFATENGLISFRSDATIWDNEFNDVKVFPNPVRPEFGGPITIQGLGYDSDIKITDVSGNVVFESRSNGGTVIWDGNLLNGERVKSGIYLVWAANTGNVKGKNVSKIVVLN